MTETGYSTRINKFDSFFLWVASLSGVGFSIFITYLKLPLLTYFPIFLLIAIGLGIGYLNGAIFCDSFTNRIRGWSYVLIGLAIYVPLATIKFSEAYLSQKYPEYVNLEPILSTVAGIVFVVIYLICMIKVTPKIYESFGLRYGVVTKKILNRTTLASVISGFTLFIFVSAISLSSNLFTFGVFILLILFLAAPIFTQERRVKKLSLLERFQDCVNVETLEKKFLLNLFLILSAVLTLSLLIISQLSHSDFQVMGILILSISFIASILGLYFGLLYSDRGDLVKIKETLEAPLTENEIQELNRIVNLVNS
jgi:hypothetical protein